MNRHILFTLLFCCAIFQASCQSEPPSNLSGESLRTWLKENWYDGKHTQLGYNNARTAMYSYVDVASDGRVYCVYTGFNQPAESTTFLDPINAEHTVPQSFFDRDEPMRSDLHHLFPTHEIVNSSRGNIDFGEVDDNITDKWFIGGRVEDGTALTILNTIPNTNIDEYSEIDNSDLFEVKEANKGNTARAIFYFYTMYPTQGGSIEDLANLETLLAWHAADPVDDAERTRNDRAAERQGNRNPYVDYPELAGRAWGSNNSCAAPTMAASAGEASLEDLDGNRVNLSWTPGDGTKRLILMKRGTAFDPFEHPVNGLSYNANEVYQQGEVLGSAFAVYDGTDNAVQILNIDKNTTYAVKIIEYSCDPIIYEANGYEFSFTTTATGLSEDLQQAGISLMPNPVRDILYLYNHQSKPYQFRLLNLLGQVSLEGQVRTSAEALDVSKLSSGMYLLHIQRENSQWITRIQIQ